MDAEPTPKRAKPGRPELPAKKRRVQLYLNPALAAFLEGEDIEGEARREIALRRKRDAAEMLLQANIQSRII